MEDGAEVIVEIELSNLLQIYLDPASKASEVYQKHI